MTIRDCKTSEEARANGFSTLQWLRAFTFAEHSARKDRRQRLQREWQDAIFPAWEE